MQPCLFPKVLYTYTSTSQQWFFVLLQIVIGSQPYQGIQEALYILAPTRSFRNTIFIKNMYSQDSILTYCCPSSIDSFTSLKELCTAVSLKMTLDSCQRYAALPYIRRPYKNDVTLCKERCDFMLGMSYYRKKIVLHKACIGGLKTNVKGHAETCLLVICSSLGCVVFPPMVSSRFLGGCPNHEKIFLFGFV